MTSQGHLQQPDNLPHGVPADHEEANGDFWRKCSQESSQSKESFRRQLETALTSHQNINHPLFGTYVRKYPRVQKPLQH